MTRKAPTPDPRAYAGYNALVGLGLLPAGLTQIEMKRSNGYIRELLGELPTGQNNQNDLIVGGSEIKAGKTVKVNNATTIRGVDGNGVYHHFSIHRRTPVPGEQMNSYITSYIRTTSDFTNVLGNSHPQPENARLIAGQLYEAIGTSLQAEEAKKPVLATRRPSYGPQ